MQIMNSLSRLVGGSLFVLLSVCAFAQTTPATKLPVEAPVQPATEIAKPVAVEERSGQITAPAATANPQADALWQNATTLKPRSKAEREAAIRELEAKYGPKPDPRVSASETPGIHSTTPSVELDLSQEVSRSDASANTASMSPANAGGKVRIDLFAEAGQKFRFIDVLYSRDELIGKLQTLSQRYQLDHLVLYPGDSSIDLQHLIEVAKVAEAMRIPAVYQNGGELRAVITK